MICNKCGKNFFSRALLVSHCCDTTVAPQVNLQNKIICSDVQKNRNSSRSYQENLEPTDESEMDCANLENHDSISKAVISVEDIKRAQIREVDMAPCSSKTIFDYDELLDMDTDKDPNWCPEDDGSNGLTRMIQQISHDAISQKDQEINIQVHTDGSEMDCANLDNHSPISKSVRSVEDNKRSQIREIDMTPCSSKTIFDSDDLLDADTDDSDKDPNWCPEDNGSNRLTRIIQQISNDVKRTSDTDGEKVSWLKIKWLRFTKEFGIIQFKYSLDEQVAFKTLDLKRGKTRGRPSIDSSTIAVPLSYSGPLGINPKKKKDLLSMLDLIDKDFHNFYENLPTTGRAPEFHELEDNLDSDSDD